MEFFGDEIRRACSARIASRPPSTPTTPSYFPAFGIASICEPVPTTGAFGIGTIPAREGVSDRILPHGKPSCLAACLQPGAGLQIGGRENDSGDRGRLPHRKSKLALRSRIARRSESIVEGHR